MSIRRGIARTLIGWGSDAEPEQLAVQQKGTRRGEFLCVLNYEKLSGVKPEFRASALRVGFRLATALLRGRLERAQPAHFLEDTFGVELVL